MSSVAVGPLVQLPRSNWRDVLVIKPTHSRLVETPKIAGEQLKRANDGKACQPLTMLQVLG